MTDPNQRVWFCITLALPDEVAADLRREGWRARLPVIASLRAPVDEFIRRQDPDAFFGSEMGRDSAPRFYACTKRSVFLRLQNGELSQVTSVEMLNTSGPFGAIELAATREWYCVLLDGTFDHDETENIRLIREPMEQWIKRYDPVASFFPPPSDKLLLRNHFSVQTTEATFQVLRLAEPKPSGMKNIYRCPRADTIRFG